MKNNLYKYIEEHSIKNPEKIAINFEQTTINYLQLFNRIELLASYISINLKCKKGDRIAILSLNRIEFITLFYACSKLGTILVPINWRLTKYEITNILKNVTAKLLFTELEFKNTISELYINIPKLRIIGIDFVPQTKLSLKNSIKINKNSEVKKIISDFNHPILIVHTSGTTGQAKGAVLSQKAVYYNILNSIHMHKLEKSDHILTVIPLFHVGGLNIQTIPAIHIGATVTLHRKFDLKETFKALKLLKPTFTVFVPTIMEAILNFKDWSPLKFSSLKAITTGSTIVAPDLIKTYEENNIPIIQVYGSTETGPIAVCQNLSEKRKPYGNSGTPALYTKAEIFNNKNEMVKKNIIGEIGIRGPNLFSYYWKDKKETKKAFINGWFMTGDYAKKNEKNQFFIAGRKENIIISGGENIYSAELEQVFLKEKNIEEAAVIGIPDKKWQEIPIVFVKTKKQFKLNEYLINNNLKTKLAKYKIPRILIKIDEIPKNALGKIDYKLLRDYYNDLKSRKKLKKTSNVI